MYVCDFFFCFKCKRTYTLYSFYASIINHLMLCVGTWISCLPYLIFSYILVVARTFPSKVFSILCIFHITRTIRHIRFNFLLYHFTQLWPIQNEFSKKNNLTDIFNLNYLSMRKVRVTLSGRYILGYILMREK